MLGVLLSAALAGTVIPLLLFPGGRVVFVGALALVLVRRYGLGWSILCVLICGGVGIGLGFPLTAAPLIFLEPLIVAALFSRGMNSVLAADLIFWCLFGLPLEGLFLHLSGVQVVFPHLQALWIPAACSLANALLAALVLRLVPSQRRSPHSLASLYESQLMLVLFALLIPPLMVLAISLFSELSRLGWSGTFPSLVESMRRGIRVTPIGMAVLTLAPALASPLLLWLGHRRLVSPVRELSDATRNLPQRLAEGELPEVDGTGCQEMEELAENVRALVSQFRSFSVIPSKGPHESGEASPEGSGSQARHNWELFTTSRKLQSEMTERRRIQDLLQRLEVAESKYRFLVEQNLVGVFILKGHRLAYVNPRFVEIFGFPSEDLLWNTRFTDLIEPEDRPGLERTLRHQMLGKIHHARIQVRGRSKDGKAIHLEVLCGSAVHEGQMAVIGSLLDITQRKEAEETVRHMAYHDSLTGLPNRNLFRDRMDQALAMASRDQSLLAVLFIDLDRFKGVNDSLGHAAGDKLLREMALRLQKCIRDSDTVSRFGGDEFNILLTQVRKEDDVALIARKILRTLQWPFSVEEHELSLSGSIGIALYPRDGTDAQALIRNADTALYRAKDLGRNNFQLYHPAMNIQAMERMELENSLRRVLDREQLRVYYQPQVEMRTGRIIGVEALLRWEHSSGRFVSPATFIPLAEELGLILPIGEWVLRTACRQIRIWEKAGYPPLRVGVNVSAEQFQAPNFIHLVESVLEETGLDPKWLNLELTETVVVKNVKESVAQLKKLHEVGITVAIDDFGVGYSSLSYLKDFPVDQLKIDRSFVCNLPGSEAEGQIARHIVKMAHSLGLKVIAEGVESGDQLQFLSNLGCNEVQGFYISPPVPAEEFVRLLEENVA